jgi:hypothetical protein
MKFTPAQLRILWTIEKRPALFTGRARRPLETLAGMQLVWFHETSTIEGKRCLRAGLTRSGADFIYEGGIDH